MQNHQKQKHMFGERRFFVVTIEARKKPLKDTAPFTEASVKSGKDKITTIQEINLAVNFIKVLERHGRMRNICHPVPSGPIPKPSPESFSLPCSMPQKPSNSVVWVGGSSAFVHFYLFSCSDSSVHLPPTMSLCDQG